MGREVNGASALNDDHPPRGLDRLYCNREWAKYMSLLKTKEEVNNLPQSFLFIISRIPRKRKGTETSFKGCERSDSRERERQRPG